MDALGSILFVALGTNFLCMFIDFDLAFSALIYVSRATKYLKSILKHYMLGCPINKVGDATSICHSESLAPIIHM